MSEETKISVPKLAADGSNWVIYRDRMVWAMDSRDLADHLTNTTMPAAYRAAGTIGGVTAPSRWAAGERTVKHAIATLVHNSMFNKIKTSTCAKDAWDMLKALFEGRSQMIIMDLCRKIQSLKCREDENLRTHLNNVANLHKQLATMGTTIPDNEYASILLGSIPPSYETITSAMSSAAKLGNTALTPSIVTSLILDEYDRRVLRKPQNGQDEALGASTGKEKQQKKDIECFNCKKCGHMKANCWAKGGGKEGQGLKKKGQNGTAAAEQQQEPDIGAWVTITDNLDNGTSQSNWSEVEETLIDEEESQLNWSKIVETLDIEDTSKSSWAVIEEILDEEEANQSSFMNSTHTEGELYDSGTSCHMSPFRHQFISIRPIVPHPIMAVDNRRFFATGMGDLHIRVPNGESSTPVILHNALYTPEMALTVTSVNCITKAGYMVLFEKEACKIKDGGGKVVGVIPANNNGLYHIKHMNTTSSTNEAVDVPMLHCRMGHIAADSIHTLVRSNAIQGISLIDNSQPLYCKSCEYAKTTRKAIKKERKGAQASAFGEEIHSDLWGPSPLQTLRGRKYYITFTDNHLHFTWTQLLQSKDEALQAYKAFVAWAQTQHGTKIKCLRSDQGGEYTGDNFSKFLKEQGTEHRLTTHDTPQHNRVAESLNRRLLERTRAILHHSGLTKHLWGEAVNHATWLKNRTLAWALGNTMPFEQLYGQKPSLANMPKWGQKVWVHTDSGSKLDAWAVEGHWLGYNGDSTHAHCIYLADKN